MSSGSTVPDGRCRPLFDGRTGYDRPGVRAYGVAEAVRKPKRWGAPRMNGRAGRARSRAATIPIAIGTISHDTERTPKIMGNAIRIFAAAIMAIFVITVLAGDASARGGSHNNKEHRYGGTSSYGRGSHYMGSN